LYKKLVKLKSIIEWISLYTDLRRTNHSKNKIGKII